MGVTEAVLGVLLAGLAAASLFDLRLPRWSFLLLAALVAAAAATTRSLALSVGLSCAAVALAVGAWRLGTKDRPDATPDPAPDATGRPAD